ncbi:glutamine--fructose-6-phosphate transaminase (isomerizing) [Chloroflexus sp. MS-G]|jgi:glucosamine--fructose-6-phosphate aminotransferase (isomerizing)|uniref:glutamine--fructose-6-phosphate transaminase (isomerizing) n=1 Tax=Chloroflexus sp. MS-G TaxID=1521187 RepID=UPI0004DFA22C|nr:glutamine--fructose-6-phosphate transaminase (isomerizing) [Chloroflexus sp. MS-G]MBO9348848.1 glutamine--fructose-6-phosphate transaminase (isomerizing) [Chloroflexus sp.]
MCGIVGYVGAREATEVVLHGLQRLEYRGYDSAGVAIYDPVIGLQLRRSVGKLSNLQQRLLNEPTHGHIGIGHTRWATHGGVTEINAHPHRDASGAIVVIQNGIVENYLALKGRLLELGYQFESQTDTEVIAKLLGHYYNELRDLGRAMHRTLQELRGGNAIVAFCIHEPDQLVAARLGNAGGIAIGIGNDERFIASDIPAILDYTRDLIFLEDRDIAVVRRDSVTIMRLDGTPVERPIHRIAWDPVAAAKGDYRHFMQKEIDEQPRALMDVLRGRIDQEHGRIYLEDLRLNDHDLRRIRRIYATACGTAWHAALVAKFMIEHLARVRVEVDYASEFRYRNPVLQSNGEHDALVLAITQSGETVDTLAAMEEARLQGAPSIAIVNAIGSQAARVADGGPIYLHAGPEIGVASTKAFTSMLVAAYLFALRLAQARGTLKPQQIREHIQALIELPGQAAQVIEQTKPLCIELAERYYHVSNALFLGRQINYPIALEGALKLKEISYIHAEGYPAGEMKHGPIALIDENMPVICIATHDHIYEKMISNIEQVRARHGQVIAIGHQGDELLAEKAHHVIGVPTTHPLLQPVLNVIPLQMFAYHVAVLRGCDVDQPRNLAKSVTVE